MSEEEKPSSVKDTNIPRGMPPSAAVTQTCHWVCRPRADSSYTQISSNRLVSRNYGGNHSQLTLFKGFRCLAPYVRIPGYGLGKGGGRKWVHDTTKFKQKTGTVVGSRLTFMDALYED